MSSTLLLRHTCIITASSVQSQSHCHSAVFFSWFPSHCFERSKRSPTQNVLRVLRVVSRDIVSAITLAHTVISSLRSASGSSSEHQTLISQLYTLESALLRVKNLELDNSQYADALREAASQCQRTIDAFADKIVGYQPSLGREGNGKSHVWKKVNWVIIRKDDLMKFKTDLVGDTKSIELLLMTVQVSDIRKVDIKGDSARSIPDAYPIDSEERADAADRIPSRWSKPTRNHNLRTVLVEYIAPRSPSQLGEPDVVDLDEKTPEPRQQAAATGPSEIDQEFLDAVPEDIPDEIIEQERHDQRRREREEL
ncbi:uncharacterized protein PAC_05688 [Phialocephala subalpina]|uniref:Fungal N-terminal domain-containing protein n=1 Tax=Phialocephala subalpina TaxID=576137 RepID=A0A1L7WSP9_9HELO|nr:uncharacterized protein PAC_05688 [Phialocephala subalpina]